MKNTKPILFPEQRRQERREDIIGWIVTVVLGAFAALLLFVLAAECMASTAHADIYQCGSITGCVAWHTNRDGEQERVIFRKGDVVNTGAGWFVSTDDGWERLRRGRGGNDGLPLWDPETLLELGSASWALGGGDPPCVADDASLNDHWTPPKWTVDYVDLAQGARFWVVYSPRKDYTYNVTMSLFDLGNGNVLLFGTGYGNTVRAERSPAEDMALVDRTIRDCIGYWPPASVDVTILAPHWHPDHMAPESVHALRALGYNIVSLFSHEDDADGYANPLLWMYDGGPVPLWNAEDAAVWDTFGGTGCDVPLVSWWSSVGNLWVRHRPGHTPGSIDLVIDVLGNPADRVIVLGSGTGPNGGVCPPLPGERLRISAHGNVIL